jgi:hypothetical protein
MRDSTDPFERLKANIADIAAVRNEAREHGLEMPEDIRRLLLSFRAQLRGAGVSNERINATPGLELPEGDERCARCDKPAPDDSSISEWEAFGASGEGWLCPDCITPEEQRAMDDTDMEPVDRRRKEARLRSAAARQGLRLRKAYTRDTRAPEYGSYVLLDPYTSNGVVAGGHINGYGLALDEVAETLAARADQ